MSIAVTPDCVNPMESYGELCVECNRCGRFNVELTFNHLQKITMTIDELKQTDWYNERPDVIKQAICKLPPTQLYKFKDSGKQCQIYSYSEPESGKLEDVTCTVQKTGVGGPLATMGLGVLDKGVVFSVNLDDLEPWE